MGLAAAAVAERAKEKEEAEVKEMTFHPKIDKNSMAMAKALGRDGSKVGGGGGLIYLGVVCGVVVYNDR